MKFIKIFSLFVLLSTVFTSYPVKACTIVSCSMHGEVFAAANEDDYTPFSKVWFNPRTTERYGSVCFGAPDLQVGAAMNEYGLFYDYTAQYTIDPTKHHFEHPYNGDIFFDLLGKCKTVNEALQFLETHDYMVSSQVLLADATGNSVIINIDTKVLKKGAYQINTNFNICNASTGNYTCGRYDIADRILSKSKKVSVPFLKDILNKTHQEGSLSTQYSNIYDLKRGLVYVYLFHDYEHVYVINLKKELAKGYRLEMLANHFPMSFAYQSYIQNNPLFRKEKIMLEMKNKGVITTTNKYVTELNKEIKTDSTLSGTMFNVGIQLMKDANNEHSNGKVWEYWFSFSNGYNFTHYNDERLDAAAQIFSVLRLQWTDIKYKNFFLEMMAYINLVENKTSLAIENYQKLILIPSETLAVTFNRSKEVLKRIGK